MWFQIGKNIVNNPLGNLAFTIHFVSYYVTLSYRYSLCVSWSEGEEGLDILASLICTLLGSTLPGDT